MKRDLISITDLSQEEIAEIFSLARRFKADLKEGWPHPLLAGKTLAMIFEKSSLRTRVTFEAGMVQLGGYPIYLSPPDIGLGTRESPADVAQNLGRWVNLIMVRTFSHQVVLELASNATIPVINGLSDLLHPCQVLADCFTLLEKRERLDDLKVAFVGDGNNVVNSWLNATTKLPFHFVLACPPGYEPHTEILQQTRQKSPGRVLITHSIEEAVHGADVIYTDVWASMGQEKERVQRREAFQPYQVNATVLARAQKDALVMHCLPAHRGEEITNDVIDGPQSIILDQSENRLHVQKAIMVWLLRKAEGGGEVSTTH
jgi:ornithine carbamoyltransferase